MAVNYMAMLSWGMYGGATASQRANLFASWGLMQSLISAVVTIFFRRTFGPRTGSRSLVGLWQ